MNIYTILQDSMNVNEYGAISLGQLIDTLERAPQDRIAVDGFGKPGSWRGVYAFLRFDPKRNATAAEMLRYAREAVGATFEGYKGGEYTMTRDTPCFIDGYGDCDSDGAAITPGRLAQMLGVAVADAKASELPKRPGILEAYSSHDGVWGVFIPEDRWEEFKKYVCELESIAARSLEVARNG